MATTSTSTFDTSLIANNNKKKNDTSFRKTSGTNNDSSLNVTILSAYDLFASEHPVGVELSCLGQSSLTDAPSARLKDRNSFKFRSTQTLRLQGPLPELYKTTATVTVKYRVKQEQNLSATIPLKSLKIGETTWLVLNLVESTTSTLGSDTTTKLEDVPPTLRLQIRLEGSYRPEIGLLMGLGDAWFRIVDRALSSISKVTESIPSVDPKYLLIPMVPIATGIVVASPIIMGVMIVFLPFLLPVFVFLALLAFCTSGLGIGLYASTAAGRGWLADVFSPFLHTVLSTPSGQRLVYETGPRPNPVSVARVVLPKKWQSKLLVSLFLDLLGSSSYLLPLVGELFDVAWAPLQTIFIMAMYEDVSPALKYISFVEEILPFTDIIPSATLGWIKEFGIPMAVGITAGVANPSSNLAATNTNALLRQKNKNN